MTELAIKSWSECNLKSSLLSKRERESCVTHALKFRHMCRDIQNDYEILHVFQISLEMWVIHCYLIISLYLYKLLWFIYCFIIISSYLHNFLWYINCYRIIRFYLYILQVTRSRSWTSQSTRQLVKVTRSHSLAPSDLPVTRQRSRIYVSGGSTMVRRSTRSRTGTH